MSLFERVFGFGGSSVPHLDAVQARAKLQEKPAPFVLDVREPEEYKAGHIEGARLIPLGQLRSRMKELPRDREVLCVCHSGNRSGRAARELIANGFKATNLRGGMTAWTAAGLPMRKGMSR